MNRKETKEMFFGAPARTFVNAKKLRTEMTEAENKLWERLKKNQVNGYKFRRQHPISNFIVDFYCHELKLVIEVDGKYHDEHEQKNYDSARTEVLNELGLRVLRFNNEEIEQNIKRVLNRIKSYSDKKNDK